MSESKHTPGPWHIGRQVFSRDRIALEGDCITIAINHDDGCCEAVMVGLGASLERIEANARLIAAAPDLLAACEAMLSTFDPDLLCDGHCAPTTCAVCVARAAIEKARAS